MQPVEFCSDVFLLPHRPPTPPDAYFYTSGYVPASKWNPPVKDFPVDGVVVVESTDEDFESHVSSKKLNVNGKEDHHRLHQLFRSSKTSPGRLNPFRRLPTFL